MLGAGYIEAAAVEENGAISMVGGGGRGGWRRKAADVAIGRVGEAGRDGDLWRRKVGFSSF